jgi:hypothetical protein
MNEGSRTVAKPDKAIKRCRTTFENTLELMLFSHSLFTGREIREAYISTLSQGDAD